MLVGGCGKGNQTADESPKANPVKELTAEEKKALRDSVVGEYELKHPDEDIIKYVLLENGIRELYANGKLASDPNKWSIVDGEIHFKKIIGSQMMGNSLSLHETYLVWRINTDKSITEVADIFDGKRTDWPKDEQTTWKKIK